MVLLHIYMYISTACVMAMLQYKVCLEHQKCIIQMHVWCALHTLQGVLYTLSISVKYTPHIWCALHTLKSVHVETLLAHHIWCRAHILFYSVLLNTHIHRLYLLTVFKLFNILSTDMVFATKNFDFWLNPEMSESLDVLTTDNNCVSFTSPWHLGEGVSTQEQ